MARPMKPLVRGCGYYPSNRLTPLVYPGGYTTAQGSGGENPLPDDYEQVNGFAFDSDCYFVITGLKLKGSDTVRFSMIPRTACNVPTGSHGMPEGMDDTWDEVDFTAPVDMCIGTTASNASSAKFKGSFIGAFVVDGRFNGIPCKRKVDDALGYYDTMTGTFFEPTLGTPTVVE